MTLPTHRAGRLQAIVVAGVALLVATLLAVQVPGAEHPVAAAGIGLQTLAGLLAAIQLWANSASDAAVRWMAEQVADNRWRIAGLFDGRLRSFVIAAGWYLLGLAVVRLPLVWVPVEAVGWLIAIPALLILLTGAITFMLATFMFAGSLFIDGTPHPDGEVLTVLRGRLDANDWIWPLVGLVFVLGGVLQVASA